jgi:O-antigen/teichoic acid export membrane protein
MRAVSEPESQGDADRALLQGFARSVRDNAFAEVAVQLTRVGGIIYLARHLEPSDFGLYRMLLVIGAIAMLMIEAGIPDALIQRKTLGPQHEATGWWINCTIGALAAVVLYRFAPLISGLLIMPGLAAQLRLLCLPILLLSASITAGARLRRNFRFGPVALADTLAELGFLGTAITLLLVYRAPRWALAGGLAARYSLQALVILIAEPYAPRELPRLEAARDLARFALSVTSGRLVIALSFNADFLIIGRILGSTTLGYYGIAWDLLRFVPDRLFKVVGRVTLPLFSTMQDDDAALRRRYCDLVRETSRILLPMMTGLAIAAPEVVVAVYGAQWHPAAGPLRALTIGITLIGVTLGIGSIYYAKGRPVLDLYLHSARLALIVAIVSLTAPHGLLPASIGMSTVEGGIAIVGQLIMNTLIALSVWEFMRALAPGIRNAVWAAIATELGRLIAAAIGLHAALALVVIVALPAAAIAVCEMPKLIEIGKMAMGGQVVRAASSDG